MAGTHKRLKQGDMQRDKQLERAPVCLRFSMPVFCRAAEAASEATNKHTTALLRADNYEAKQWSL